MSFFYQHAWSLAGFFGVVLVIFLSNLWALGRLKESSSATGAKVSVLVPMRDEEGNAEECVRALLAQDHEHYEVLVYEEGSQDRTPQILASIKDSRLRVLQGDGPPPGWLGKAWACQNLAQHASGELLLFVDADVRLSGGAVSAAVAALAKGRLDLLSVLPRQEVGTLGETLVVPLISWSLSSFFPFAVGKIWPRAGLAAAVGQFLLFRREAYAALGGHEVVRSEVLEDVVLARKATQRGLRVGLVYGGSLVRCRMYTGLRGAVRGFAKSLFPVFGRRTLFFLFVWNWLLYATWQPPLLLVSLSTGWSSLPQEFLAPAAWASGVAFALWLLTTVRFRFPWYLPFIYPVVVGAGWTVAMRSLLWHVVGWGTWKGRSIHTKEER